MDEEQLVTGEDLVINANANAAVDEKASMIKMAAEQRRPSKMIPRKESEDVKEGKKKVT